LQASQVIATADIVIEPVGLVLENTERLHEPTFVGTNATIFDLLSKLMHKAVRRASHRLGGPKEFLVATSMAGGGESAKRDDKRQDCCFHGC